MIRMERNRYSALLRADYLKELSDKDGEIQAAAENFLNLPPDLRRDAVENQRIDISYWSEEGPADYQMWLDIFHMPDELISKLQKSYRYDDVERILNAAIKVWLREHGKDVED
jgi:hypothetical protein